MEENGDLNETIVILYSDHGLHMRGLSYLFNFDGVKNEIYNPALLISFPERFV